MKERFVPFVCYLIWTYSPRKTLLSSQNKVFRADPNYIKEMHINLESFVIIRGKKFHVEIRVLMFFLTCLLDLVSKIIRVPKVSFHFFLINWNRKLEIKFWFSFLYWSWHRKHKTIWFFDFENNWTFKFKYEVRFSFLILIWKTKNQSHHSLRNRNR